MNQVEHQDYLQFLDTFSSKEKFLLEHVPSGDKRIYFVPDDGDSIYTFLIHSIEPLFEHFKTLDTNLYTAITVLQADTKKWGEYLVKIEKDIFEFATNIEGTFSFFDSLPLTIANLIPKTSVVLEAKHIRGLENKSPSRRHCQITAPLPYLGDAVGIPSVLENISLKDLREDFQAIIDLLIHGKIHGVFASEKVTLLTSEDEKTFCDIFIEERDVFEEKELPKSEEEVLKLIRDDICVNSIFFLPDMCLQAAWPIFHQEIKAYRTAYHSGKRLRKSIYNDIVKTAEPMLPITPLDVAVPYGFRQFFHIGEMKLAVNITIPVVCKVGWDRQSSRLVSELATEPFLVPQVDVTILGLPAFSTISQLCRGVVKSLQSLGVVI